MHAIIYAMFNAKYILRLPVSIGGIPSEPRIPWSQPLITCLINIGHSGFSLCVSDFHIIANQKMGFYQSINFYLITSPTPIRKVRGFPRL